MPRAATPTESLPPVVDASPAVARAIEAFLAADRAAADAGWLSPAHLAREAAWQALEGLVRGLPRAWHLYRDIAWGVAKTSKAGWTLVRKDPDTIRQAANERGERP